MRVISILCCCAAVAAAQAPASVDAALKVYDAWAGTTVSDREYPPAAIRIVHDQKIDSSYDRTIRSCEARLCAKCSACSGYCRTGKAAGAWGFRYDGWASWRRLKPRASMWPGPAGGGRQQEVRSDARGPIKPRPVWQLMDVHSPHVRRRL